jgi:hypothetical protein
MTDRSMKFSSSRTLPGQANSPERASSPWDLVDLPVHFRRVLLGEVPGQDGYVFGMIAQRRRGDRENLQPVIEIAAEEFIAHHLGQIPVGCRHQPHIDGDGRCRPVSRTTFSCRARSNLGCRSSGISPTSSRNSVPAWAISKRPIFCAQGAGEGSPLVAEQLAFEQAGGNGGAVQRDERKIPCADSSDGWRAPPIPCRSRFRPGSARSHR